MRACALRRAHGRRSPDGMIAPARIVTGVGAPFFGGALLLGPAPRVVVRYRRSMSEYEHAGGGGGVVFWVDPSSAQVLISAFLVRAQILPRRAAASARFCTVTRRRWLVGWLDGWLALDGDEHAADGGGGGWCRVMGGVGW